jgi:hypothetical protein
MFDGACGPHLSRQLLVVDSLSRPGPSISDRKLPQSKRSEVRESTPDEKHGIATQYRMYRDSRLQQRGCDYLPQNKDKRELLQRSKSSGEPSETLETRELESPSPVDTDLPSGQASAATCLLLTAAAEVRCSKAILTSRTVMMRLT